MNEHENKPPLPSMTRGLLGAIFAVVAIIAMFSVASSLRRLAEKNFVVNSNSYYSPGGYAQPEIMDSETALNYVGIYFKPEKLDYGYTAENPQELNPDGYSPDGTASEPAQIVPPIDTWDAQYAEWLSKMEKKIISGAWGDFPYVSINGELRFSKTAIDEWLAEQARNRIDLDADGAMVPSNDFEPNIEYYGGENVG